MVTQEFLRPRRQRMYIRFAAAAVILSAIGAILYTALGFDPESQVEEVLTEFSAAIDHADQAKLVELMCAEEAAAFTEDDDYDPTVEPVDFAVPLEREFTGITVTDGQASAQVHIEGSEPATIHLRLDQDRWKICAPA